MAVGAVNADINGDGKSELLVHIVDSTRYSTFWRLYNKGYYAYDFATLTEIRCSQDTTYKSERYKKYKSGGEYWVTFDAYKKGFRKDDPAYLPPSGKTIKPLNYSGIGGSASVTTDANGRWHTITQKAVPVYNSTDAKTQVDTIPSNYGVILTWANTLNLADASWYYTTTGKGGYIRASDIPLNPPESKEQSIGTVKHDNLSITVQSRYSDHWLTAQPYADKDKMVKVSKGTEMKVVRVIYNTAKHYWVQVEYKGNYYYACANNVELVIKDEGDPVTILGKQFPSGNLGDLPSYNIEGTVTSPYKITTATGGIYPIGYPYIKTITVNKNSFDLKNSDINIKRNGGIAFGNIPTGSYTFKLLVNYEKTTWVDQTRDDIDPIQTVEITAPEFTSTFTITRNSQVLVAGLSLDITSKNLLIGESFSLKETITPGNATNKKISWSSSNNSVATVVAGKVTAVGKGSATIYATAQDNSGKEATCTVTVQKRVTDVSISPSSKTLFVNGTSAEQTANLTKTIAPSDASNPNVTWASSNSGIVSVDQSGNITAKAVGTATITAKANDGSEKQGTCQVTVLAYVDSVTLSGSSSVNVGESIKLIPSISPANADNKSLTWTSSDTTVATVDEKGNVRGVKAGYTVTITATANDRGTKADTFSVAVVQPVTGIDISGSSNVLKGNTLTLSAVVKPSSASNKTISWSSDDMSIATINNGTVTGVAAGNTTIWATATDGSGVKTPYGIHVLQPVTAITISGDTVVPVDGSVSLSATVAPANADNPSLRWIVSPSSVAIVSDQGVVTGLQPGQATVTASSVDGSGISKNYDIQVVQQVIAIKIEGDNLIHTGNTAQFAAIVTSDEPLSDTSVTWSSSDTSVATVDASGVVTGIGNGTAVITAISNAENYYSAHHRVTVDTLVSNITVSGTANMDAGDTEQFSATVTPVTATNKALIWASSNKTVAVVNGNGLVSAVAEGTTTITAAATDGSGVKGTFKVTVYPLPSSVAITGESDLLVDTTAQFTTTVLPANTRNKSITWSSSNPSVVTVNSSGLVTAKANGTAVITATAVGNVAVIAQHEVSVTTLVSTVTLDAPDRIDVGEMGTITATVLPETASNQQLVWTSSDEDVAVVDANGNVFGIAGGYATVKATTVDGSEIAAEAEIQIYQYVQSISVDVDPVAFVGQVIHPSTIILPEDVSDPYATWTSSNDSIIRIEEFESESDYELRAVCLQPGVAKITATATDGSNASGYA